MNESKSPKIFTQKREHSRKPDELYPIIEACSPWPCAELFARGPHTNWKCWGAESEEYIPAWDTYANHSQASNPVYMSKVKEAKPAETPILAPVMFIEKALKAAKGRELKAKDVYAAYEAQCAARHLRPVKAIGFWQTLSARAKKLGATKTTQSGRVVYFGLKLAA